MILLARTLARALANGLALVLVSLPWAVIAAGFFVAYVSVPNLFGLGVAAVIIGLGWLSVPKREAVPEGGLRRKDAPELYRLTDALAKAMDVAAPKRIIPNAEYAVSSANGRVLMLGLPLWHVMGPLERVAILTREIAQSGGADPARRGLIRKAKGVLTSWSAAFSSDLVAGSARAKAGDRSAVSLFMGAVLGSLDALLTWLVKAEQRSAEQAADAAATKLAGSKAAQATLIKQAARGVVQEALSALAPTGAARGRQTLDALAARLDAMPEEDIEQIATSIERDTAGAIALAERIDAARAAALPSAFALDVNWAAIERELEEATEKAGLALLAGRII